MCEWTPLYWALNVRQLFLQYLITDNMQFCLCCTEPNQDSTTVLVYFFSHLLFFPLARFLIFCCILFSPINWWLFPSCNKPAKSIRNRRNQLSFSWLGSPATVCSTILHNIFCIYLSKKSQKYSHCVTFTFTSHLSKLVHLNKIIVMEWRLCMKKIPQAI